MNISQIVHFFNRATIAIYALLILIVSVLIIAFVWLNRDNHVELSQNERIGLTPARIRSIESIGEWEFLAVSDEELVDTVRYGLFGDAELVRVYYGTMRLGINLREAKPGWIKAEKDTVAVTLPAIKLLDEDFIDEAMTRPFFEKGSWKESDKALLYKKAYRLMRRRGLSKRNLEAAQRNAVSQFHNLLSGMGFKHIRIDFAQTDQ